jgi:hypothetical protein
MIVFDELMQRKRLLAKNEVLCHLLDNQMKGGLKHHLVG